MDCENCMSRPASVHHSWNGGEAHLCEQCARTAGVPPDPALRAASRWVNYGEVSPDYAHTTARLISIESGEARVEVVVSSRIKAGAILRMPAKFVQSLSIGEVFSFTCTANELNKYVSGTGTAAG